MRRSALRSFALGTVGSGGERGESAATVHRREATTHRHTDGVDFERCD
ncbi:hypothetical protein [Haloprofundus halobius]|nr:hypothetical protein [Haloprofundus halobius]